MTASNNPLMECEEYRIPSGVISRCVYRGGDNSFSFHSAGLNTDITRAEYDALKALGHPITHEVRSE